MPNIGILQINCSTSIAGNEENLAPYLEESGKNNANIICLPELYRTHYFCKNEDPDNFNLAETIPGPSTELCSKYARKYEMVIIIPVFEFRDRGIYHNSVVIIETDGSIKGVYRKMHIPHDPGFEEKYYFTPGDQGICVFKTTYGNIAPLICWDQWFPEAARIAALKGADIIFYPTAIAWDEKESKEEGKEQLEAWEAVQRGHSIANNVFVCAVNRIGREDSLNFWGNSFLYNPFGKILAKCSNHNEENLILNCDFSEINKFRNLWPFFRDRRIDIYQDLNKRSLIDG